MALGVALTDSALRGAATTDQYSWPRTLFRRFVHWGAHTFILSSTRTRHVRVDDVELEVPPSVFHPGHFITSRMFASYLRSQDFRGKRVVEVGTGSGILAISAALAGASRVLALDINPNAVRAARMNANANGVGAQSEARVSDLFSALAADETFDVVISSPPSFAGEPADMADRAWFAGPGYAHLGGLFRAARAHLNANGEMLLLLSSDTNIAMLKAWALEAGFSWQQVAEKSIWVESFVIFRLTIAHPGAGSQPSPPESAAAGL
jgi:release factor glutamine methyltransferase